MKRIRIRGRTAPKIQLCPTCGRMRVFHTHGYYHCPTPVEVIDALRAWRREHGSRWKSTLCDAWTRGDDLGQWLQQARNIIGPTRLYKLDL